MEVEGLVFDTFFSPYKGDGDDIKGVLGMAIDITKLKAADKELKARVKELEEFYEMAIDREIKMKGLKEEIRMLRSRLAEYEQ